MDKIFVGNVRMVDGEYGQIVKVSFNEADIQKMQGRIEGAGKGWCTVEIKKRKNPDGKKTHYAEISTYESKRSAPKEREESGSSVDADEPAF